MEAYMCSVCGYLYDDETAEKNQEGQPVPFKELEDEWVCPNCGVHKDFFMPTNSDRTPDVKS